MFQKSHFYVHVKVLYNSLSGHNILTSFVLEENLCWEIALFTRRATPPLFHMDFRWQFRGIRYYGNKIAKSIASKAFLGYFSLQNSTHFDVVFRPASNSTHYLWVTFFGYISIIGIIKYSKISWKFDCKNTSKIKLFKKILMSLGEKKIQESCRCSQIFILDSE